MKKEELENQIFVPISNIEDMGQYVNVYSDNLLIGKIPIIRGHNIFKFDTDITVLNNLNWFDIYQNNKDLIDSEVYKLYSNSKDILITISTFRKLYVKFQTEVEQVDCQWQNASWRVTKI